MLYGDIRVVRLLFPAPVFRHVLEPQNSEGELVFMPITTLRMVV